MITIFFFYGLSFIILGSAILLLPRKHDYFHIEEDSWSLGLFSLIHGLNEWVDMLIVKGDPFDVTTLKTIGNIVLPLSFTFLVIFGSKIVSRLRPEYRWIKYLWIPCAAIWGSVFIITRDHLLCGIAARYFICVPATILSATGLYSLLKNTSREDIPKITSFGMLAAILSIAAYCFLAGIITPKAPFFPAAFFNYENFRNATGLPVQLFRMFCAICATFGFLLATGQFGKKDTKVKFAGGIKRRVATVISISVCIIMILSIGLTYVLGANLLRETIGKQYEQMAIALELYVSSDLAGEVEDTKTYATRPLWIDFVKGVNSVYKFTDTKTLLSYFSDMDKRWAEADKDSPFIKDYTNNRISASMIDIMKVRKYITEIFVTDKMGGIAASSGKTSDFYQGDEGWWQEAYDNGSGSIYVSGLEFDHSSKMWSIAIALPMKDQNGEIVGICKNSVSTEKLFGRLKDFKIGKTGHAVLIDKNGYIIFHGGVEPMSKKHHKIDDIIKIESGGKNYGIARSIDSDQKKMFVAFADIKSPYVSAASGWKIFISQNADETLKPLNDFIFQISLITIFVMILMIPLVSIFGDIFARPIRQLHATIGHIMNGNWDHPLNIKTGDEIEQFANTFKDMIHKLKSKQQELLEANKKLENLSKNLEDKVTDRTKELNKTQEATLNILEDLTEAKARLEKEARALAEAMRIKSEFTSTVSHELRTPLAAIKESISLVSDGTAGPIGASQKDFLDMAKRNVDRLTRLINNILDFQKLEAGKMTFNIQANDINDTIAESAKTMAPLAEEKGLDFILDLEDGLPKIYFDKDKIIQVLTNLISNSLKFTEKGSITISTQTLGNDIQVSIEDTGTGIAKENLPKLFQRFEQLEKGVDRKTGGTGLGLAISKEIIGAHKGKIWAESEPLKGTKFNFTLPLKS